MPTFKAVTEIRHGKADDEVVVPAGAEVKKSDFDDDAWTTLLAAGAITGATTEELKDAEQARTDAETDTRSRDLLAREEELDRRESQLDSREASLNDQLDQLKADQAAFEVERKAFETAAKELAPKKSEAKS